MNLGESSAVVRIGKLTSADLEEIMAIEESSFTLPWSQNTFESLLARKDADLLGARDVDGSLVGYSVVWTIVDQAELGNVAVAPEGRRRGVGRALVVRALDLARSRSARECFLEVREANAAARALYEELGFAIIGRRRRYYNSPVEDALVMRLEM